jgi:hypothetical protein
MDNNQLEEEKYLPMINTLLSDQIRLFGEKFVYEKI